MDHESGGPNICVGMRVHYGGVFKWTKNKMEYVREPNGGLSLNCGIWSRTLTVKWLTEMASTLMGGRAVEMWYRKYGKNLTTGRTKVVTDLDVWNAIKSRDRHSIFDLYITLPKDPPQESILSTSQHLPRTKNADVPFIPKAPSLIASHSSSQQPKLKAQKTSSKPNQILRRSPRKLSQPSQPSTSSQILRRSPRKLSQPSQCSAPNKFVVVSGHAQGLVSESEGVVVDKSQLGVGRSKGKGAQDKGTSVRSKEKVVRRRVVPEKRKGKGAQREETEVDDCGGDSEFTDSEVSDDDDDLADLEWQLGDEHNADNEDLCIGDDENNILNQVEKTLAVVPYGGSGSTPNENTLWGVDDVVVGLNAETDEDSEELRSLQGSDDEEDSYPTFNPSVDFNRRISLKLGLKFPSNKVLRKALVTHSVENGYDFYYLHNGNLRVTTYCKNRCKCVWNVKRTKLGACTCGVKRKCPFKIHARKVEQEESFQIKALNLRHTCGMTKYNTKLSSEYLAEKFLEFWRTNTDWKLKKFQEHVLKELNVYASYGKCWLARARAKLLIYGNAGDQYARVWDYAAAVKKYNNGSTAIVVCDRIERPPPIFQRIYICLNALKEGFLRGCRPILGVDGCHLKGLYPGMCLVAVAKDGNNNIFPLAWATVEVENSSSWRWFLQLLINDLGMEEGNGLTLMSDRQKGLLDALALVAPKAEIRYCARHIWANFKLSFTGQLYKDTFWKAARATTKAEFDSEMEGLKFISTEAWSYLNAIPPQHWSRHAFSSLSKSNMLLNNVCETFNSAIKEARDKPILTQMEWMRRYVMKRTCEKRAWAAKYDERFMPFINKYINWAVDESKLCRVTTANVDEYEVDYKGDTWVVNMTKRTCSCYNWELSGVPCQHAVACIHYERGNPDDYVDVAYSKDKYVMAYTPTLSAMPGVKHWEKSGLLEPLPPPVRVLPGRPKSKKRRKEPGEDAANKVKRVKRQNKCGKCGQLGHSKRTCQSQSSTPQAKDKKDGGRPIKTTAWAKQVRDKARALKAAKEAYQRQHPMSSQSAGPSHDVSGTTTSTLN